MKNKTIKDIIDLMEKTRNPYYYMEYNRKFNIINLRIESSEFFTRKSFKINIFSINKENVDFDMVQKLLDIERQSSLCSNEVNMDLYHSYSKITKFELFEIIQDYTITEKQYKDFKKFLLNVMLGEGEINDL